jgi:deoxycytidylate deaminase
LTNINATDQPSADGAAPSADGRGSPEDSKRAVLTSIVYPELVICLCAAVGTDTGVVTDALGAELRAVSYEPVPIRLSQLMVQLPGLEGLRDIKKEDVRIRKSMLAGNALREQLGEDAMARLMLTEIHAFRKEREHTNPDIQAERSCFIVSSLKRKEEWATIRTLFGTRAFLVSIYEPRGQRTNNLCKGIAKSRNSPDPTTFEKIAGDLIDIDQKEQGIAFGQRLEEVFPLADVFLKADERLRENARRFVQLLFRAPYITPTIDEFLMFHARASSQRTADLSRQVGAVISTKAGEILATGCNEVPKAGGGVVWDKVAGTSRDYRDYKLGQDGAAAAKKELVADVLEALAQADWLKPELKGVSPDELAQRALFSKEEPLAAAKISNTLEFGRIVHAEMAAICDAAMRGVSIRWGTLYCTTFPCHMCARHIIAAGIRRVVYIEPYPKSQAKRLYAKAIRVDEDADADPDAVKFEAFVGISPTRFLDLFEMVGRKDGQGYALNELAPAGIPKGVSSGALVSEMESEYLVRIATIRPIETPKLAGDNGEVENG